MTLLINDEEVKKILTFEDTFEAIEDAYRQYGKGLTGTDGFSYGREPPPKREVRIKGKGLPHGSPQNTCVTQGIASLEETKMVVLQHSFRFLERRSAMFHLIDMESGKTLALIMNNDGFVSWMRTSIEGAVAAKFLSRKDSKVAGILGTGKQGKAQLEFLTKVRQIEKVYAHSGRRKDEEYARTMSKKLGIDVIATNDIEEVVRNSEILAAVTRATIPIVKGEWVNEGLFINGMGADCPLKAQLDASTLKKADKIVIDCKQVLDVAEMRLPLEQGVLKAEDIYGTIGEVVARVKPGRENDSEIIVYESTGMTVPYVAISTKIYEKARKLGLGKEITSIL